MKLLGFSLCKKDTREFYIIHASFPFESGKGSGVNVKTFFAPSSLKLKPDNIDKEFDFVYCTNSYGQAVVSDIKFL